MTDEEDSSANDAMDEPPVNKRKVNEMEAKLPFSEVTKHSASKASGGGM